jgi:arginine-tRNA-protein transferase
MTTSIVLDCGESVSECGYTKLEDASATRGLWAFSMAAKDYQELCDRNWRRSGKYLYKPDHLKSEVIQYTIRLDTHKFKPTKKQRSIIRKLRNYLTHGDVHGLDQLKEKSVDPRVEQLTRIVENAVQLYIKDKNLNIKPNVAIHMQSKQNQKFGDASTPTAINILALAKKQNVTLNAQDVANEIVQRMEKDILYEKIQVTNNGYINFYLTKQEKQEQPTTDQLMKNPHKLSIDVTPSIVTDEGFQLYKKYQVAIHKDDPNELTVDRYKSFLVDSPMKIDKTGKERKTLQFEEIEGLEGLSELTFDGFQGYGSYHVRYRIDGKLFMVGVVDILPRCLSSVYLYYDPDMSFLTPGVYSALAEISYVKAMSKILPELKYYYMGFYIHSVPKMRYKMQYEPSDLLCPVTLTWVPFTECKEQVEKDSSIHIDNAGTRTLRLAGPNVRTPTKNNNIDDILLIYSQQLFKYQVLKNLMVVKKEFKEKLESYKHLVGDELSKRMALVLNEEE